jgi:hypothetical protein
MSEVRPYREPRIRKGRRRQCVVGVTARYCSRGKSRFISASRSGLCDSRAPRSIKATLAPAPDRRRMQSAGALEGRPSPAAASGRLEKALSAQSDGRCVRPRSSGSRAPPPARRRPQPRAQYPTKQTPDRSPASAVCSNGSVSPSPGGRGFPARRLLERPIRGI